MNAQQQRDEEILQRVLDRVERGVAEHKEIEAEETMPVLRAAERWRRIAMNLWEDKQKAEVDSMSLGPAKEG